MIFPWLTVWHLSIIIALGIAIRLPGQRRNMLVGGLMTLPVLLLIPILSSSYFGLFESRYILEFFINQGLVVFSLGMIMAGVYEKILKPKITRKPSSSRYHFMFFGFGLVLSLIIYDLFKQPLLPSLLYGLGLNFLLAFQYYSEEIYDIAFSTIIMALFYTFLYVAILFDLPGEAGNFWFSDSLSGLTMFGIAIEKIITIAFFGAFWGPIYVGLKDVFYRKN